MSHAETRLTIFAKGKGTNQQKLERQKTNYISTAPLNKAIHKDITVRITQFLQFFIVIHTALDFIYFSVYTSINE